LQAELEKIPSKSKLVSIQAVRFCLSFRSIRCRENKLLGRRLFLGFMHHAPGPFGEAVGRIIVLTEPEFAARVKAGDSGHAQVHGITTAHVYRLSNILKSGRDVLIDIDTHGAATIRNLKTILRDSLADVFIMPPDVERFAPGLRNRAPNASIETTLTAAIGKWNLPQYRTPSISRTTEEICRNLEHHGMRAY